ncbi:hypothetical protein ASE25_19330 [Terrabacter sp. Root85]|uniref:hypothetical protein n=1 Tax=Terrabacter sp. Root85 TaxID=1736603 RepID=UPI0006FAB4B0|nr:hypothetical protein [Terrabacter sp. Root85]KRC85204.1 hypothetical protein ASE25_19330 [Terrabacter sp. Root85]
MTEHDHDLPEALCTPGERLWRGILADFDALGVEPDARDLRWLEDAARLADHIDRLEAALAAAPLTARGSHGGTIVNPLIPELRQTRALLALTLRRLDLSEPDEEGAVVNLATGRSGIGSATTSTAARKAAAARWGR